MTLSEFIHQKSYEHVELVIRHDWITFVPALFFTVLLLIVPVVVHLLLNSLFPEIFADSSIFALAVLMASIYYLSVALFFYSYFVTFYLDMVIITNDRLMEISQSNLFNRSISEMDIFRVQDATSEVKGFFASVFNYGDLLIQDASAVTKFKFNHVHDPDNLRQKILELAEFDRKYHAPQKGYVPG